ncbi:MAG TPA: M20/M25/M40 family metallo-hydrolase [Actinobacteria bacterium]|nr:M20/M25/M40 family metallo-hydrolase [Actinomycetota bacterium]
MIDSIRLVNSFIGLTQIDSESFKEGELARAIINKLAVMGVDVRADFAGEEIGGDTGNLILRLPGKKDAPSLLFLAHMDTVSARGKIHPVVEKGIIESGGDTILGADDKVGIAAIIELIEILKSERIKHGDITAIFTVAEEKGSLGAKHIDFRMVKADHAFILDGEGSVGRIIINTPSQNIIKAKFIGKSAHAGIEPEAGVSSIQAASDAISNMKLGRIDDETMANIGVVKGGTAFNVVAAKTYVEGETRSFSLERLESQTDHMKQCFIEGAKKFGAKVDIKVSRGFTGFHLSPNDKIVKIVIDAIKGVGLEPELVMSGGGSDANVLNEKGISAINLAIGMKNPHSEREQIAISELETLVKVLLEIVKSVS